MVEKPMGATVQECLEVIAARDAAGRRLMVAHRARFEPVSLMAATMVREGRLGEVGFITTARRSPRACATSGAPSGRWRGAAPPPTSASTRSAA